jgi:hypothetical protein
VLAGVSGGPSVMHVHTLMLQVARIVEEVRCAGRRLSSRVVKERFRHRLVCLVALSPHSRGTYVKVRLNQLQLALSSYRETRSVLLRGRLFEIILVKGLVVCRWVLWRILGAAIVTYLKVVRLQMLDKISRCLHVLSVR